MFVIFFETFWIKSFIFFKIVTHFEVTVYQILVSDFNSSEQMTPTDLNWDITRSLQETRWESSLQVNDRVLAWTERVSKNM